VVSKPSEGLATDFESGEDAWEMKPLEQEAQAFGPTEQECCKKARSVKLQICKSQFGATLG
jgi:hypothetical protein